MRIIADKKLTPKQERFCEEFLKDRNATQAAIRAGYSKKTAGSIGDENLKKPEIRQKIESSEKQISEHIRMTVDEWAREVSEIARSKRAKESDRLKAYDMLGKHIGAYDRKEDNSEALSKLDEVLDRIEGDL